MTRTTDGVSNYTVYTYDDSTLLTTTSYTYNASTSIIPWPLAARTSTTTSGDLTRTTDGASNNTVMTYDATAGVLTTASYTYNAGTSTYTLGSSSTNVYDLAGNLTETIDGDLNKTDMTYDADGNVLTTASYTYNAGTSTYTLASSSTNIYDLAGS